MNLNEISKLRLYFQGLSDPAFKDSKQTLNQLGAIQAQDYQMGKMAIGLRIKDGTEAQIDNAIKNGEIIRTHVLRPTWHYISADDVYWMLELSAQRLRNTINTYAHKIGISEELYAKSEKILQKELQGKSLPREKIHELLVKNGVNIDGHRLMMVLMRAETDTLICNGPELIGKSVSYALLEERVPNKILFSREESLSKLARIFFSTRGPATLQDFVWWSGLTVKDAKLGLENIRKKLNSIKIDNSEFFLPDISTDLHHKTLLLPGFDEIIISYKDKTGTLKKEDYSKVISKNAIFKPVIVHEGHVVGIWKNKKSKNTVNFEFELFENRELDLKDAEKRLRRYFDPV
jgi:hypothetical protein